MKERIFGKTNCKVSEIGLGTWQLGTKWGEKFNKEEAFKVLDAANKTGITFIDTADIYPIIETDDYFKDGAVSHD